MTWALAKAKDNFSEVVDRALREGPQYVTRHGKDCVVILSREEFDRLEAGNGEDSGAAVREYKDFKDWLFNAPVDLSKLDLTREKSPMRAVDLEDR